MSVSHMFLVLLALVAFADAKKFAPRETYVDTVVNSSQFITDTIPTTSGELFYMQFGAVNQLLSFTGGMYMAIGWSVTSITAPTTVTLAMSLRDATKMPNITLTAICLSVANGKSLGYITSDTISSVGGGGVQRLSSPTAVVNYPLGSTDAYGNVIEAGDNMVIDTAVYFSSSIENQAAQVEIFATTTYAWVW